MTEAAAREPGGASGLEAGPEFWTPSQINLAVRTFLEEAFPPLWVVGELGSWTRARSGHCYFTLKDEEAQIRCVMWRSEAARLPADPEVGMRLRALGRLTLYEARGEFQLVVRVLEGEEGEGLWRLAFERLRRLLEEEGLLAPERKRPLPPFPRAVGVVTSPSGAALHDILTVLRRRAPWTRVILRGARVQGEGAAEEIAAAVSILAGSGLVDVLIVGRGGGSLEDLWAFNEEPVARAIAASPVPVVSAVGHEVDVTIADLVADHRAPTPSAAAEAVVQDGAELRRLLRGVQPRLVRSLQRRVERTGVRLQESRVRLLRLGGALVPPRRERLARLRGELHGAVLRRLEVVRGRLLRGAGKLEALSPLATLRRGYAVPLGAGGRVLRGVDDFLPGLGFTLRVVDGRVQCVAGETRREEVHLERE